MIFSNFKLPEELKKSDTMYWMGSDNTDRFEKNLKKYTESKHLQNYIKNPIEYELNNYGFRTPDDFEKGDVGTVYLGCSHTLGMGHYLKDVWSYKLHNEIGEGKFFNLSHGGTGLASQYYFLKYFSDKLKIKKVYHYYPLECFYRYGLMNKTGKIEIIANLTAYDFTELQESLWKEYLIHKAYNEFHNNVFKDAIKNVCKEIGCEYVFYDKTRLEVLDPYSDKMTPARDLMHYYVERQHEIYETFLKISGHKKTII